jgi:hypothetical protein
MHNAHKMIGVGLCALGAVVLAWLSLESTSYYWVYLMLAALLGVAAGVIKNLPDRPR